MTRQLGNLDLLSRPAGVAIIGASPDTRRYPGKVVRHLVQFGFPGRAYAVNPRYEEVMGLPCYPDIGSIPDPVDTALLLVSAAQVPAALQQAADAGCRAAVVFSAGMAEAGGEGLDAQAEIGRIARSNGMRVLGPNCLGVANIPGGTVMSGAAAFQRPDLLAGNIGIAAQSGGVMGSIVDRAFAHRIGISHAFSTGNEADIDLADCIAFLAADSQTRAIALFVETVRDPARFVIACEAAAAAGKPIVALKVGRSEGGRRVALTHTAALAGDGKAYDALFRRLGIIGVDDIDELFLTAHAITRLPPPPGPRVGIACISGGIASLAADLCEHAGLPLAKLSPETTARIAELQKGFGGADNPLDITGHVVSEANWWMVRHIMELMLDDEGVDALIFGQPTSQFSEVAARDIVAVANASSKPLYAFWTGRDAVGPALEHVRQAGIPIFERTADCVRVVSLLAAHAALGKAAPDRPRTTDRARQAEARALLAAMREGSSETDAKRLLGLYGIASPREALAGDADAAVTAGERIGYPVVLKAHGSDFQHKSDVGGVRLNLGNAVQVAKAHAEITSATGAREVLVAEMVPQGVELILGLDRDPQLGLMTLVGSGGILVELLRDSAMALAPLRAGEGTAMLDRLAGGRLLDGVRGQPALGREGVLAALEALSQLAFEVGDHIDQLDINPVIVNRDGVIAVDALVIARPESADPVHADSR